MSMRDTISILFHFGQGITHDLPICVLSNVGELGAREAMIETVCHLVVLRKAKKGTVLHAHQVSWPSTADVQIGCE